MSKRKSTTSSNKINSKSLVIFTLIILVFIIGLFFINQTIKNQGNPPVRVSELPSLTGQPVLGQDDAPVTIVEFGDYKCPSCKYWGDHIFPQLKEKYIDTGIVTFSYINVLFHGDESLLASLAGESVFAQDPEAFWAFHKRVFDEQPPGELHDEVWVTTDKLLEIANSVTPAIDTDKLKVDLVNQSAWESIQVDNEMVKKYHIERTPTIMINGIVLEDPFDYNKIVEIIAKETGDAK